MKMSKSDILKVSGMSLNTMTKLTRDEPVMLTILDKVCATLGCNYGDIMDYVSEDKP